MREWRTCLLCHYSVALRMVRMTSLRHSSGVTEWLVVRAQLGTAPGRSGGRVTTWDVFMGHQTRPHTTLLGWGLLQISVSGLDVSSLNHEIACNNSL